MVSQLLSLSITMLVAPLAPFVASLVPGRAVPEVVFLVFAGAPLGPHGADVIRTGGGALSLVSELGMAFLFLMAGYEIRPSELVGPTGRHASLCWGASLAAAIALVSLTGFSRFTGMAGIAFAIMLTTTAYGTLAPIMRVAAPAHPVHALSSIVSGEESANEALRRQRRAMQASRRRFEAARARRRREPGEPSRRPSTSPATGETGRSTVPPATTARDSVQSGTSDSCGVLRAGPCDVPVV
ncbi:MAG: cation:proton antiporter [Coriobacteriaceae bacterium]|nr:cation:proton antiporter [Coriobacteriaceae bacterium]